MRVPIRLHLFLLVCVIVLTAAVLDHAATLMSSIDYQEPIMFVDAVIEQAIRNEIQKPLGEIHPSDVVTLTSLMLRSSGVRTLDDLSHCRDLEVLWLSGNEISNIDALSSLPNLRELDLSYNPIASFQALVSLKNLRILVLPGTGFADPSTLEGLESLQMLVLGENSIRDLKGLESLSALEWLALNDNEIEDLSPLRELVQLESLDLAGNRITNLDSLQQLHALTELNLSDNLVVDLAPLESLTNLSRLTLTNNRIHDIGPLTRNPGLYTPDRVSVRDNFLFLSPQFQSGKDITLLLNRGVDVCYDWQKPIPLAIALLQLPESLESSAQPPLSGFQDVLATLQRAEVKAYLPPIQQSRLRFSGYLVTPLDRTLLRDGSVLWAKVTSYQVAVERSSGLMNIPVEQISRIEFNPSSDLVTIVGSPRFPRIGAFRGVLMTGSLEFESLDGQKFVLTSDEILMIEFHQGNPCSGSGII